MSDDLIGSALAAAQAEVAAAEGSVVEDVAEGATGDTGSETAEGATGDAGATGATGATADPGATGATADPKEDRKRKDLHRQAEDLRKKNAKIQARLSKAIEAETRSKALEDLAQQMLSGDARTILAGLGRLTGRDPIEVYRSLSVALATDGKGAPPVAVPPEVAALKAELEQVKAAVQQRTEQEQHAARLAALTSQVRTELNGFLADETLPELRDYAAHVGAEKAAVDLMQAMNALARKGEIVTSETIAIRANHGLRKHDWRTELGVAATGPGTSAAASAAAKTGAGQSTPRGQSIAPSVASTATRTRPMTDEEREREVARLAPAVVRELGFIH
jgi:hypothetical protein